MFWPLEHTSFSVPLAVVLSAIAAAVLVAVLHRDRALAPWICAIALAVPWLVGLGVKAWLMALGQPTWPLRWLIRALPMLVPATVLLALPLIALAVLAQRLVMKPSLLGLGSRAARSWLIAGVVVGSVASMTLVFSEVFWQFDPIIILAMPRIWQQYAPGAVLGGIAGWLAGRYLGSPKQSA